MCSGLATGTSGPRRISGGHNPFINRLGRVTAVTNTPNNKRSAAHNIASRHHAADVSRARHSGREAGTAAVCDGSADDAARAAYAAHLNRLAQDGLLGARDEPGADAPESGEPRRF